MSNEKWRDVPQSTMSISDKGRLVSITNRGRRLLAISKHGYIEGGRGYLAPLYLRVWGRELDSKPYPVRGQWLERFTNPRSVK